MKYQALPKFVLFLVIMTLNTSLMSQEAKPKPKPSFSHKGIKASLGSASFDMISERGLEAGEGGVLSLGYGMTDRTSFWLSLLGAEHHPAGESEEVTEFAGLELNLQHKFRTDSRWQPYGKLGFGLYSLQEMDSQFTLVGTGINLALGMDYFFSKHFGVGAEIMYKKLDYVVQSQEVSDGALVTDLEPNLNGDTAGFMITITVQ